MSINSIILSVIILVLLILLWFQHRHTGGIYGYFMMQASRKRENHQKILKLLQERGELSNSDIRAALGISERSVVRYMEELEKEGKVEQIGSTGRDVVYRLKR